VKNFICSCGARHRMNNNKENAMTAERQLKKAGLCPALNI